MSSVDMGPARPARSLRSEFRMELNRPLLTRAEMMTMQFDPSPVQTRLVLDAIARMWDGSGGDPVPAHLIYPPTQTILPRARR